jgi:uncharacterized Rossmann fold enzyme
MLPKEILKDDEFSEIYHQIINDLGFSHEEDLKARDILYDILLKQENYSLESLLTSIKTLVQSVNHILIIGGGPDASRFMQWVNNITQFPHFDQKSVLIIAIDGATELLARYNIIPHIIFTDLDGIQISTVEKKGYDNTFFIVHAHGDNQEKLSTFASIIKANFIIGTTQTVSKIPVVNSGGFTDGDRALYFLENFLHPSHQVYLIGYDFNSTIGKFSKPHLSEDKPASSLKKKKLDYGAQLTRDFCKRSDSKIKFLECNHNFTLQSDLLNAKNCSFSKFQSKEDIVKIFPVNLLYLKKKL